MSTANPQIIQDTHPCFYADARGKYGRIHLPVAPSCNIECAYCRRDYDCAHENRPGATGKLLGSEEALDYLERALKLMPQISVAAVAGPGDAFCSPHTTLRTLELIRKKHKDISLCVSTNGLNIKDFIPQLCRLNVRFVTITVNAVDATIGSRLCKGIAFADRAFRGIEAARILISRQLEAISSLKAAGIIVKVNTVVVPGINEDHVLFVAKKMGRLGVDLMNFLPLIPLKGTDMESIEPPDEFKMRKLRQMANPHVSQMHHCRRCRSDAVGLLG